MPGAGSPVLQLMQSLPLSVLPSHGHPLGHSGPGIDGLPQGFVSILQTGSWLSVYAGSRKLHMEEADQTHSPLFGKPEAEAQIIHVCIGSLGCIQLAGKSMQCFQDVCTQVPLTTNLTEGISERIVLLNKSEALA